MQNLLGTCVALALLAGGFALTGDLGWLLRRGMRVIHATDVPDGTPPVPAATVPATASPASRPPVAAPPRRVAGPERLDLAATRPGQRILVWLDAAADALTIDVVDPATAAVILHDGPPRRATITGGALVRGTPLRVITLGLAHAGTGTSESLGKVAGIAAIPSGR